MCSYWLCCHGDSGSALCPFVWITCNCEYTIVLYHIAALNIERQGVVCSESQEFVVVTINLDVWLLNLGISGVDVHVVGGDNQRCRILYCDGVGSSTSLVIILVCWGNGCENGNGTCRLDCDIAVGSY